MTNTQLKKEISTQVGFAVKVKDNGTFFAVSVSRADGTQSFHEHKAWFNERYKSVDSKVPVCVDANSAFISKKSFNL